MSSDENELTSDSKFMSDLHNFADKVLFDEELDSSDKSAKTSASESISDINAIGMISAEVDGRGVGSSLHSADKVAGSGIDAL